MTAANDNNGAPRTLASVSYDAQSRRQSVSYVNGTSAQYGYTARGDLTCHDWNLTGAAPSACNVAGAEIAYDFTYNGVGQLVAKALNDPLLKWSPPGNSSDAYAANGLNQYTAITPGGGAAAAIVHDGNGNITTDHRGRTYVYDAENVLRAANDTGGAALGAYAYYADGARKSKTAGGATSTFYYTGDQEIAEYAGATLTRRYVRLPGSVDEPFLMIDYSSGAGVESWAHQNRLGSVVAVSDAAGAVTERYTYSAYGESGNEGDAGFPFRFTGQKLDAETGLYYYKARYYDPETGRFMQTDPIGYKDQMNLYGYALNDPINGIDPTGLATEEEIANAEKTLGALSGGLRAEARKATSDSRQRGLSTSERGDLKNRARLLNKAADLADAIDPAEFADFETPELDQGALDFLADVGRNSSSKESVSSVVKSDDSYSLQGISKGTGSAAGGTLAPGAIATYHNHTESGGLGGRFPGPADPFTAFNNRVPAAYGYRGVTYIIGVKGGRFTLRRADGAEIYNFSRSPSYISKIFDLY